MLKRSSRSILNEVLNELNAKEINYRPMDYGPSYFSYEIKQELNLKELINSKSEFYFSCEEIEILALSENLEHSLDENEVIELIDKNPDIYLLCALPFNPKEQKGKTWKNWQMKPYVLPKLALIKSRTKNKTWLQVIRTESELCFKDYILTENEDKNDFTIRSQENSPNHIQWNQFIKDSLQKLSNPEDLLTKVVCARTKVLKIDGKISPVNIFNNLQSQSSYYFYLKSNSLYFMGNTPERLLSYQDKLYQFDALAGTRPRSEDPEEDLRLERELFDSKKEQFEHHQVVTYITQGLQEHGEIIINDSFVLKLKSLQHIKTPLSLKVEENSVALLFDLLERLHPTPAVCGMPKEEAYQFLLENDPIERGLYAGAIGVINKDFTQICVAIRSLLIDHNDNGQNLVTLYGGAGIVSESTPEQEWLETGHKMNSFSPFKLED